MTFARTRPLLLLTSALPLSACASIPLGTLWKLRDFDAASVARIDPGQLRVAGRIDPAPLRIRTGSMPLTLTLQPRNTDLPDEVHTFGLRDARVPSRPDSGRATALAGVRT